MDKLPISVIIAAKNAEKTIEECLISVQRNNPTEIIVVDGNSTDSTMDIVPRYTDRIYSDEGKGLENARQLGADKATQEYIAYIDSDVVLAEGALAAMLASLQHSDYVWVNAQAAPDVECSSYWEWAQYQHDLLSTMRGMRKDYLCSMAGLVRRETILKYRWDTAEKYLDDLDLEIRLRRNGHKFGNSPALFCHRYRADFISFVKHRLFYGHLAVRYMRKHGAWHIRFWPPLADIYWLGFCLVKGKPKLLPYFAVDAVAESAGIIIGLFRPHWGVVEGKSN